MGLKAKALPLVKGTRSRARRATLACALALLAASPAPASPSRGPAKGLSEPPGITARTYPLTVNSRSSSGRLYMLDDRELQQPKVGKILLFKRGSSAAMAFRVLRTYPDEKKFAARVVKNYDPDRSLQAGEELTAVEKIADLDVAPGANTPQEERELRELEARLGIKPIAPDTQLVLAPTVDPELERAAAALPPAAPAPVPVPASVPVVAQASTTTPVARAPASAPSKPAPPAAAPTPPPETAPLDDLASLEPDPAGGVAAPTDIPPAPTNESDAALATPDDAPKAETETEATDEVGEAQTTASSEDAELESLSEGGSEAAPRSPASDETAADDGGESDDDSAPAAEPDASQESPKGPTELSQDEEDAERRIAVYVDEHEELDPNWNWLSLEFGYFKNAQYFAGGGVRYGLKLVNNLFFDSRSSQDSLALEGGVFYYKTLNYPEDGEMYNIVPIVGTLRYNILANENFGIFFYGGMMKNFIASSVSGTDEGFAQLGSVVPAVGGGLTFRIGPNWETRVDLGSDMIGAGLVLRF
jgi:hypothetical protein